MSVERANRGTLQHVYEQTIDALVAAAAQRDQSAEGHSRRVTQYSVAIAQGMGLSGTELANIKYAAGLHDIGKIAISRRTVNRLGRLTPNEFEIMKQHSLLSIRIIEKIDGLKDASQLVKYHYERYDGKGYPDGLMGESIPIGSRIICVAEAFDILTSDVPWRDAMEPQSALAEIDTCAGSQFDPAVVCALRAVISSGMRAF